MADAINVRFSNIPKRNAAKSEKAGRPIFDDQEVVFITHPADKETEKVFPAHEVIATIEDPESGLLVPVTYATKYNAQYLRFKEGAAQIVDGTPLTKAPFMSPAKALEYRALKVYTVEQLANIDGQQLKNLGVGARELKMEAQAYINATAKNADFATVAADNAALRAELEALKEQLGDLKAPPAIEEKKADLSPFEEMDDASISMWIADATGAHPAGNPDHATLVSLADEINADLKKKAEPKAEEARKVGRPKKAA